jgi:uncharacterized membrane protein YhaH (DUF805 family)
MTSNERTQLILSLALGAAIFTAMNYDTSQVWLVILAGYLFVVVVSYVRRALAVRRMVRALRRLDPAFRRQVVNSINSESVRDYYDQRLRLEGDADVAGVVERYPFAPSDRSEQTRWYWTLMLVAGLALASPILWPHMAVWQRAIALTVVLICLGLLAMNRRRMRRLDTVLEVSPYGLAEIHPDGTRRVLTFNQPLACRVNRWRSRVEVAPVGGRQSDRIFVDFDRVGFNRLFMAVLLLGKFIQPKTSEAAASEQPSAEQPSAEQPKQSIPIPVPLQLPTFSQWQAQRIAAAFWPALLMLALALVVQRLADRL